MSGRWPCAEQPGKWGAGKYPADLDVALPGCGLCPRDHDECLADFASHVHPVHAHGMVVAGMHGADLRRAMHRHRGTRDGRVA